MPIPTRANREDRELIDTIEALEARTGDKVRDILLEKNRHLLTHWEATEGLLAEGQRRSAFIQYLKRRHELRHLRNELEEELGHIIDRAKLLGFSIRYFDTRIKSFPSLARNWLPSFAGKTRNGVQTHFAAFMDDQYDLLGVRIVALSLTDVTKVARLILGDQSFAWSRRDLKNFYHAPKEPGYRSWHLRTTFYPSSRPDATVKCEIQIRTGIEDTWAEWEHELGYKRPESISQQSWGELTALLREEFRDASRNLYALAVLMDRQREKLEILRRRPPESVSAFLREMEASSQTTEIIEHVERFDHTEVLAADLKTGFDQNHLVVQFDPQGFVGLEVEGREGGRDRAAGELSTFAFDELGDPGKLRLRVHLGEPFARVVEQARRKRLKAQFDGLSDNRRLLNLWARLLMVCRDATKKYYPQHTGRRFFNDLHARLNHFEFKRNDRPSATFLTLNVVRTNFAYEVCTNYPQDGTRSIVRLPNSSEQPPEVKQKYDEVREALQSLGKEDRFHIDDHGANSIGIHVNLISLAYRQPQLIITRRGDLQTSDTNQWQTTASGVACPRPSSIESAGDVPGYVYDAQPAQLDPSFFLGAQRELFEEVGVFVPVDHIRIIALLKHTRSGQPILVAEGYTDKTLRAITHVARAAEERWELDIGGIQAVPLNETNLSALLDEDSITTVDGQRIPSLSASSRARWQERSQVAIILSFLRHAPD